MKPTKPTQLLLLSCLPLAVLAAEPGPPRAPAAPASGPVLSLLEPSADGCEWVRFQPVRQTREVLARLAAGCQGGTTAVSRDGRWGALRFWRGGVSAPVQGRPTFPEPFPSAAFRDRLFLVEVDTATARELPLPGSGELIEFGFDASGQLLGLTLQRLTPEQERAGGVELDGTRLSFHLEGRGRPLLAHAFAWRDGAWVRREVKLTTDAVGTAELGPRASLGERSNVTLDPRFTPEEIESDALLDQLHPLTPEQPDGEWGLLREGTATLAVWGVPYGERALATGLLRKVERGRALPLPGFDYGANDLTRARTQGAFLLLSLADSGGHPRLYRGTRPVWRSETARAVTFWPH
ncbi:hypothetical protein [Melittangium boletus]|uniref:hypothetical protein n=1 Tax=Melittangium boletus TaxID=83453 RepID=UPI003DA6AA65